MLFIPIFVQKAILLKNILVIIVCCWESIMKVLGAFNMFADKKWSVPFAWKNCSDQESVQFLASSFHQGLKSGEV